jgi:ABC-type amino acid transport substrate-binding protein
MFKFLLLMVFCGIPSLSVAEDLIFGIRPGLPVEYFVDSDPPEGILPELVNGIFKSRGSSVEFQLMPRRRLVHRARAGSLHMTMLPMIPSFQSKSDWPEELVMGEEALFSFDIGLYKLSSNNLKITDVSELASYRLGVVRQAKYIEHALGDFLYSGAHLEFYSKPEHLFMALSSKRVDLVLSSEPLRIGMLRRVPIPEGVERAWFIGRAGTYLVFSETAFGDRTSELQEYTDQRIRDMRKHGELDAMFKRYGINSWFEK